MVLRSLGLEMCSSLWLVQIATVNPLTNITKMQICAYSWRADHIEYASINLAGSLCWVFPWKDRETMDFMGIIRERGASSTTLCNWFSKPESPEIAAHLELNRAALPSRHSHNPLPILQQAPIPRQTRGTVTDRRLSKQAHICVIAHCSPSMPLIGFASRSASEPYLKCQHQR